MFCPSCGVANEQPNQRYCQDCGTPLPTSTGSSALVQRQSGATQPTLLAQSQSSLLSLLPQSLHHRLMIGAGASVAAVVALYLVLSAIVHALLALLPIAFVLAALYAGFLYLKRSRTP